MSAPEWRSAYWNKVLLIVPIVGAVFVTISFVLRVYCRRMTSRKIDVEDLFMLLGVVFSYGVTTCTILVAFNGIGYDIYALPRETRVRATLLFWTAQKCWAFSQAFVKMSIAILIRKLLGSLRSVRIITALLIIITLAWGLAAILGNIFQCWPVRYFWIKNVYGYCNVGHNAFFMATGAISLAIDVVLVLVPLPIVWRLHMARRKKILLTMLFSFGLLVCVFSLLRLVAFRYYRTNNPTSSGALEALWTLLELNCAIICANLVLMRPLYDRIACCHTSRKSNGSSYPSSEVTNPVLHHWPYPAEFSVDTCSEVRTEAYHSPDVSASATSDSGSRMGDREIVVETSIGRDVQDRAAAIPNISRESDASSLRR